MILLARAGALGDFVLTLPVIRALAEDGPVHVVTDARYSCLLPPGATRVEAPWLWAGKPPPSPYRRGYAFSSVAADAMRSAGIPEVHAVAPRPPEGVHATAHYASVLARPILLTPRLDVVRREGERPVVIAPGSGGAEKRWPIARWRAVADALDAPVRWVRGPVETGEGDWPPDALSPDLPGLVALAASAGVWLGPDSGPSHLAAAVGVPVGVVFGPTDPRSWAPVGARVWPWAAETAEIVAWTRMKRDLTNPGRTGS